jgi:hypothetical protein
MFAGPFHSLAIMNSVLLSAPPSAQAKQPRSSSIVCSTAPSAGTTRNKIAATSAPCRLPHATAGPVAVCGKNDARILACETPSQ